MLQGKSAKKLRKWNTSTLINPVWQEADGQLNKFLRKRNRIQKTDYHPKQSQICLYLKNKKKHTEQLRLLQLYHYKILCLACLFFFFLFLQGQSIVNMIFNHDLSWVKLLGYDISVTLQGNKHTHWCSLHALWQYEEDTGYL